MDIFNPLELNANVDKMASDVTVSQDGGGPVKMHPYLVSFIRWCVSCLWNTATLLLHRLATAQLPALTSAPLPPHPPARPATSSHLHPEPLVRCEVLRRPDGPHDVDFIFVHGLYGSLENTWRQGDWRYKYKLSPNKIPLRRPDSVPKRCCCAKCSSETDENGGHLEKQKQPVLPQEKTKFYQTDFVNRIEVLDNYGTQMEFVRDFFNKENQTKSDMGFRKSGENDYACECRKMGKDCEVGCGCVCNDCYSACWPKDWLGYDFPRSRVISINYTSDPYLWRPLWVKECKRLRLHERARQMAEQLIDIGVGDKPIIWVGHSKGGLFIKQIFCEAYEAHLKLVEQTKCDIDYENENQLYNNNKLSRDRSANDNNSMTDHDDSSNELNKDNISEKSLSDCHDKSLKNDNNEVSNKDIDIINDSLSEHNNITSHNLIKTDKYNPDSVIEMTCEISDRDTESQEKSDRDTKSQEKSDHDTKSQDRLDNGYRLQNISKLWSNSRGFMFYSVPHRGSSLADIKTPITARSIELLEISKDNSLILSLQESWLSATAPRRPLVRSLVETNRTLMAVLWLTIVSVESADAGIGALCGISLDHREICKPSSRRCILYKELINLINASLNVYCDI